MSAHGDVYPMTNTAAMKLKRVFAKLETLLRTVSSMVDTSARNRFRMRPAGVVEKKRAGARRTPVSALLCSVVLARSAPNVRDSMRRRVTSARPPLRLP